MITVTVSRTQKGEVVHFYANDHANYDKKGNDIVCASVSVLLQTTVLGLTDYLNLPVDIQSKNGHFDCILKLSTPEAQAIIETMILGLKKIEKTYPSHLNIVEI